jgi:gluconokinase
MEDAVHCQFAASRGGTKTHGDADPAVAVVMGVSGAGKSTIGQRLAARLHWNFAEGDALHPPANVAKMKSGRPLTDADRAPWLAAVAEVIDGWRRRGESGVITCSALKRSYRRLIIGDRRNVRLVYLDGPRALIAQRLAARRGHFMPPDLLASQFATLEPPGPDEQPIMVGIDMPPEKVVEHIACALISPGAPENPIRSYSKGIS